MSYNKKFSPFRDIKPQRKTCCNHVQHLNKRFEYQLEKGGKAFGQTICGHIISEDPLVYCFCEGFKR